MNKLEALESVSTLVENQLVTSLKLIREGSYGILSSRVKEREIMRFKRQNIAKEYFEILSDEEINIIIEYILLKSGIKVNDAELTKSKAPDLDER